MKLKTFIDRPILSCAISVLILILGVIGLSNLPMEQYPDIAPPTIMVSTTYTGVNAETVLKSVIAPLEEAINGVENMTYMTSTATNTGSASITVYFAQGTDPDMATVNTKNRVSEAEGLLPAEVTKVGVIVEKRQNSMVKIISLYSPDDSYDQNFINNYFKINVEPRLSRISGVGNVNVMGGDYAMRIWMNPQKMAQYQLVPADVIALLDDQNVEAATGTLGEDSENTFQYTLKYRGRYETAEEFGNMVLKSLPTGEVLRLKDVADVELGSQSYAYNSEIVGHPGATCMISQTAGSNANEIVKEVAKFDEGYRSPYKATVAAMDGISAAIVTTSLVFMAVFIPTSFMGGTSGVFYTQFGLTMAVAVGISAINALTLSPALCALIMTPHMDKSTGGKLSFSSRFHHAFEASFNRLVLKYKSGVSFFLRRKWMAWVSLAAVCALLVFFMRTTKTGLVPDEDMGTIFVNVTTPPGSSLAQTRKTMEMIDERIREIPQIKIYSNVTGYSMMGGQAASGGMLIIKLKHWDERQEAQDYINAIIAAIYQHTADIKSAKLFAFAQPTIMGYGMGSGFEMYVQDRAGGSVENLQKYTQDFIAALNRRPEISMAYTTFDTKFPQYMVEVDAVKCQRAGVTTSDVLSVLSGYIGGNYSSNLNRFSKLYRVMIQARKDYRLDKESLNNMFVRTESGEMAPVGQFITLTKVYGVETLTRFNMYTSIPVNGMPADGYSSGDAIAAIEEVASQTLPTGYGYEFSGITREESSSTGNTVIIFIICIVFIYLILCSLYESIFIPMVVILAVPFGLMGSFLFAKCFGLENNIYMQTGLIMLIGLLSKTAILLTEYASARRRQGMSIAQAAVAAAGVRLRPILMTALTMIIGLFPLIVATGAGANGNRSLGVGTVGGMLVGTVALLFVVPVLFTVFQAIEERVMPRRQTDAAE